MTSAVLLGTATLGPMATTVLGQAATQSLLEKAHALEVRGRMDMAAQTWQQVLLAEPNNTEALGGLARAAKLSGNAKLAELYLDRLRAINPNDPGIAKVQNPGHAGRPQRSAAAGRQARAAGAVLAIDADLPAGLRRHTARG